MNNPRRRRRDHQAPDSNSYLPSPEEVRRMCNHIQDTWSPTEREKRSRYKQGDWTAPVVSAPDFGLNVEA
jgi:hypothetical protein